MKAPGAAATELPWLVPATTSLVALTRSPAVSVWNDVRFDPGAVLLLARTWSSFDRSLSFAEIAATSEVLESAGNFLQHRSRDTFVDWNRSGPDIVYRTCVELGTLARSLAEKVPDCDLERAWVCGLLAPLGWLALSAVEPASITPFLQEFARSGHQLAWQRQVWGLDHPALVRRLCTSWRLPAWLTAILGGLSLPVEMAQRLGADRVLFQVVQLAIALCQRKDLGLALPLGGKVPDLLVGLELQTEDMERAIAAADVRSNSVPREWKSAAQNPLVADLLRLAFENRRLERVTALDELQTRLDRLHAILEERSTEEIDRLQTLKMAALAELAAGAGHEINNPLAVISGQAQYALRQLEEADTLIPEEPSLAPVVDALQLGLGHALKTIVDQSQRIHEVLTDLRQFARPTPPRQQLVRVQDLIGAVSDALEDLCEQRKVRLVCLHAPAEWHLRADPGQVRTALLCMVRNAVEAAPGEGWAGLRVEKADEGTLRWIVEDNGPGPSPAVCEHLFDPFYSGRCAGRGRGMGLPTAWRLARQQGGDVVFEGHAHGITRFFMTLPGLDNEPAPQLNGNGQVSETNGRRHVPVTQH